MGLTDLFRGGRSNATFEPGPFVLAITGHGIRLQPHVPATLAHLSDGTIVVGPIDMASVRASGHIVPTIAVHAGTPPSGELTPRAISESSIVTYSTAERGTTQLVLSAGMQTYDAVLASVSSLPAAAEWRIVTDHHELVWPPGLTMRASGDRMAEHGPYELVASATEIVNVYGPLFGEQIPAPEILNAPGQTRIATGSLPGATHSVKHYTFEGDASAQRYYYVPLDGSAVMLVRARTSTAAAAELFAASDVIAQTLRLH